MAPASFSPTQSETALVNQIFALFDPQKFGILTGDVAIKAFAGANLPPTTLGEIWNIADEDNNGWLSRKGVSIAVRLMGWAQRGDNVSKELLGRPGPLPTIDGISIVTQQNTGLSLPKSPPPASLPPLTVQDRNKFHSLFYKAGPQNGLISGEKARGVFLKSKLSTDQLLQIWNLADTQDRGALDITDFTIGMYFIQAVMSRQLSVIPLSLPPGLYQQAQLKGSHISNNSGSFSPVGSTFSSKPSSVQPQYTGQNVVQPNYTGISPPKAPSGIPSRPSASSPFTASPFGQPAAQNVRWDITPSEKIVADRYFDDMDVNKRGYVDGDAAVPFMLKSGLGSEDLARIWDLADLDNNGQLTRDGFAVAMHLIQKRIAGQELPEVLPPSLVPPSMRNGNIHTASQQRSPEPVTDLFSFDDTPAVPSQSTGSITTLHPQQTGPKLAAFAPPPIPSRSATIDPFSQHQDLLGDDDSDGKPSSPPLHDKSAEIGNMQNQLSSTNRSLETVKNDRQSVEQIVANQEAQLSVLQTQLSSAKAAYETETKSLAILKERQMNQMTEIQKLREELIHSESNLSAVRVEKAELEGVFLRDKEEARELHRKMMEAGQEAEKLKQELERAKKEAKQQKGLLAIARKQLSTKESERAKMEKEVEEATNEVTSLVAERENVEVELAKEIDVASMTTGPERTLSPDSVTFAAQHPLPSTPEILNTVTVGRSNNPFTTSPATNGAAQPTFPADMFSFDRAFDTDEDANANAKVEGDAPRPASSTNGVAKPAESTAVTPKAQPVDLAIFSPHVDAFFSPAADDEHFVTPPSSAAVRSRVASPDLSSLSTQESRRTDDAKSTQSSEASAAHFPPIEDLDAPFVESPKPGTSPSDPENSEQKPHGQSTETNLNTKLDEFDADESDSDSEDEVPLSELAKNKPTTQDKDAVIPADKRAEPLTTFDDIFGVPPPAATEPTPRTDEASQPPADSNNAAAHITFDAFGAPTSPFETSLAGTSTTVPSGADNTGISAFDEALKLMPTRNGTGASNSISDGQQFTSNATFDEFFEFPSPSSAPPSATFPLTTDVNGLIAPTRTDDSFNLSSTPKLPPIAPDGVKPFSFEEAFSGFEPSPSTNVGSLATQAATPSSPAPAMLELTSSKPFPSTVPASPQSMSPPRGSTGYPETSLRSSSPAPQKAKPSNPPRGPSPKSPRPSTSSSKDEKPGNIPTRHSKLSKIRLPFGRKKKQQQSQEAQQTAASQPQLLSAPQEQAGLNRTTSPSGGEDVQPVKQLISLGFDRVKAIEALERNGYDFQKALDILVESQ